ncbi:hypothetical protein NDU88_003423 [Pleurodeles waltl]|uniref:Uncharacterized protein n=1 Tax=Pleurodeles waltl TaxID=8319 RepID=A0AAV7KY37_PLEWA|nr:hypothetical protein NDU88_003423 [Pleurodeles waltl]
MLRSPRTSFSEERISTGRLAVDGEKLEVEAGRIPELRLRLLSAPSTLQPHRCGAGAGRKNERSLVQRTLSSLDAHACARALSRSEDSDRLLCGTSTRAAIFL